ncbi:cysteine proteinase [Piedraia hortae CBS 480.64]|uniref:Cysteine proteinase n=1 Tax=Piedraia hortae CBS 480.64 TaxID=1314780 RepID=A0A6A7C1I0_9PEZI|nr:cysteine proteinase [Piedraia hortae CBS 480.64]
MPKRPSSGELSSPSPKKARLNSESLSESASPSANGAAEFNADLYSDLYLDTISRKNLDFDFEKQCSVTLTTVNIYACLVCGRYFSGRGRQTPAYLHALDLNHHVFINLSTKKIYILPDGYEVLNRSVEDIKYVVEPTYTPEDVRRLSASNPAVVDLWGREYIPGFMGINNIKSNDYVNVIVQILSHVTPIRDYFLLSNLTAKPAIIQTFASLIRKLWNKRAFKSHVSPHELIQTITSRSSKRFTLTAQNDPAEFLGWFLNTLHLSLGGHRSKPKTSLIQQTFQGRLRIESQHITPRADASDRLRFEDAEIDSKVVPFIILTLDLPPAPLFQDDAEGNLIPQVSLWSVLQKYNGITAQERANTRVRYRLLHPLPEYVIMHIKRFQRNKFLDETRNQTIVTFGTEGLDLAPLVEPQPVEVGRGREVYDLVGNVTYEGVKVRDDSVEGEQERKMWKVQVLEGEGKWWEMQDLWVERVDRELLAARESYIMVWRRRVE